MIETAIISRRQLRKGRLEGGGKGREGKKEEGEGKEGPKGKENHVVSYLEHGRHGCQLEGVATRAEENWGGGKKNSGERENVGKRLKPERSVIES